MYSFGIRQGRVFPLVQDSESYLLFVINYNPNPNIVIIVPLPPGTRPAASSLPARLPQRPRGGVGHGSGTSDNGNPVVVVVVVVIIVIVVVSVPEVDIGYRLREAEKYPHVDHQPRIFVIVVLSPFHGDDNFFPSCPTASAVEKEEEEEEEEEEGLAMTSLATTDSRRR